MRATTDVVTLNATVVHGDVRRSLVDAAAGVLLTGTLIIRDAHVAAVAEACVEGALAAIHALQGADGVPVATHGGTGRAARVVHLGGGAAAVAGHVTRHAEGCRAAGAKHDERIHVHVVSHLKHMKLSSNITHTRHLIMSLN